MKKVIIYTDGSCNNSTGMGGWAALLTGGNKNKRGVRRVKLKGRTTETTSNRMEMMAAIMALESLKFKKGTKVTLYTDSNYLKQGASEWIYKWIRKGHFDDIKTAPIKNMDLWSRLLVQIKRDDMVIDWQWVKGHSGVAGNVLVDRLAGKQMAKVSREHNVK